jgi:hypothetical protein
MVIPGVLSVMITMGGSLQIIFVRDNDSSWKQSAATIEGIHHLVPRSQCKSLGPIVVQLRMLGSHKAKKFSIQAYFHDAFGRDSRAPRLAASSCSSSTRPVAWG